MRRLPEEWFSVLTLLAAGLFGVGVAVGFWFSEPSALSVVFGIIIFGVSCSMIMPCVVAIKEAINGKKEV